MFRELYFVFVQKSHTLTFGKARGLDIESLPPSLSKTTHHPCLPHQASLGTWVCVFDLGACAYIHTLPGESGLPSTDLEKLPFGLSPQRFWQMVNQPQAPSQPLLRKNSPGISPPPSLSGGSHLLPLFSRNCVSHFTQGCYVPGRILPDYIAYAHFLPGRFREQMFQQFPQLNI